MCNLKVDLYWSFRSPFSYMASRRLRTLREEHAFEVIVKPVYPLVIRVPDFFQRMNPKFMPYLLSDVARTAEMENVPFGKPSPDPVAMNEDMTAADDQPYIHRLCRIAIAAAKQGDILPLVDEIGTLIYSGKTAGWDKEQHLAEAVERAGFDLEDLDTVRKVEPRSLDKVLQQNQEDLEAAGHWGVPTMVFEGEPFFNYDRIDQLIWRMQQKGMQPR